MKKLIIILICYIVCISVIGCSESEVIQSEKIGSLYDFSTEQVTIYTTDVESDKPHKELKEKAEITDMAEINKVTNLLLNADFHNLELDEQIPAEPYYYICFNNGTMISMLSDESYCKVMNYQYDEISKSFDYDNFNGPFLLDDEFFNLIVQLIK